MAENSPIEWTHHTFNPWEGCQKTGPGCEHCYAEARNARFGAGRAVNWGPGAPRRRTSAANWRKPLAWNAKHEAFFAAHGCRQRVFCASLADVFDNAVDSAWRADLLRSIMATPNLDWLLLTKRIGNAGAMLDEAVFGATKGWFKWRSGGGRYGGYYLKNIWIGATICNQEEADRDIPKLLRLPAAKRFLSLEPLLGAVDWSPWLDIIEYEEGAPWGRRNIGHLRDMPEWVIVGGESGPGARPMHPDWARSLRDQCQGAGVPFFFKQWGQWRQHAGKTFIEVGKKAAGRLLDGREWDEVPAC
ncbi:phage Gp37/Gp68 family protein [Verminephrobacter eiseniae]|uniref:phage Gp37/Gp68 family protein n=1 Tax=Verminephrobacter eiseniae TaxID=364317 RepID=UPI002236F1BD|nr:phage Gp37/Gp68 family protein [Verminephrobacter eiseniae]MCW5233499.1 phage Gp37/Gp68 family protein [Verminephrobacter eiseniae]MCW5294946.1 phage Gp37/Gp68 family protein [Verminephrobacter eiseniae]MCW8187788.1 phage Gp37/Gp68 family protein [Verminephrobacter eiseniae]MCW8225473.1 phage Gp37/Gp68 family protein [Verminephrobacter eiseniae]MCW8236444.1 phage Gp37/Gp68 family protein [Verminephrobacter eiseniae]